MKSFEDSMQILRNYDLTRSYNGAARLSGCSPHTVKARVRLRDAGRLGSTPTRSGRTSIVDPFRKKIEEWVLHAKGRVRADRCHEKLIAMGYMGSERTTRRAVAAAKGAYRHQTRRIYRPWIPEPGMWGQWDWADAGSIVNGQKVHFFCAGLAWSRLRVVIPTRNRRQATVIACLDRAMRVFGGSPSYWLTDNERTVTTGRVAGLAIKHPEMVRFGNHYGTSIELCQPADPESKGFSEAVCRLAKADLIPTSHNLLEEYSSWEQLELACLDFMQKVNTRRHAVTGRKPLHELEQNESRWLGALPDEPYTAAFGQTRGVSPESTINHRRARYSVPHSLVGENVWVREEGSELVITAAVGGGFAELARHALVGAGGTAICDAHYPADHPSGPLGRRPRARTEWEKQFLTIGKGAEQWLIAAAGAGAGNIRRQVEDAIDLARLYGRSYVADSLAIAAEYGCFGIGDVEQILRNGDTEETLRRLAPPSQDLYLQPGTAAWGQLRNTSGQVQE